MMIGVILMGYTHSASDTQSVSEQTHSASDILIGGLVIGYTHSASDNLMVSKADCA